MNKNNPHQFTLGNASVVPWRNEIEADGQVNRLQPKVMEVLCYLAANYGRVIPKEELIEHVWRGRVVTDGSVQKSINLLRKALLDALGEQDAIVHYSKKGYELQIQPHFQATAPGQPDEGGAQLTAGSAFLNAIVCARPALWVTGLLVVAVLLVAGANYSTLREAVSALSRDHRTGFDNVRGFTNELGHERAGEPHPDNQHIAYVRDLEQFSERTASELIIRDERGTDWEVSQTTGLWLDLAWSPNGQHLAVVEQLREDDVLSGSSFYSQASSLYNVHIFTLDFDNHQVLEKHRLSQWQGHINSVTWWRNGVIELVAKQGDSAVNQRYRYSLQPQRLEVAASLDHVVNPMLTRVQDGVSAIASLHRGGTRIDFISESQSLINSLHLPYPVSDLSWVPDGSGVLAHSADDGALSIAYRNGDIAAIPFAHNSDAEVSRPRYGADGQRVFFTQAHAEADLQMLSLEGRQTDVTNNGYLNYDAVFSPQGDRIAYVSVRNNQTQVWLVEAGQERQVSRGQHSERINHVLWAQDGNALVYQRGDKIVLNNLLEQQEVLLLQDARDVTPLAVSASNKNTQEFDILALKTTGDVRNLWRLGLTPGQSKQLTFGSVGSAIAFEGNIYFQYIRQPGLWVWNKESNEVALLNAETSTFKANSKILAVDDSGVYFITGGNCRESSIFHLAFDDGELGSFLPRDNSHLSTESFHPRKGVLYTPCKLAESNIMVME